LNMQNVVLPRQFTIKYSDTIWEKTTSRNNSPLDSPQASVKMEK
jgi:hypothetical protein